MRRRCAGAILRTRVLSKKLYYGVAALSTRNCVPSSDLDCCRENQVCSAADKARARQLPKVHCATAFLVLSLVLSLAAAAPAAAAAATIFPPSSLRWHEVYGNANHGLETYNFQLTNEVKSITTALASPQTWPVYDAGRAGRSPAPDRPICGVDRSPLRRRRRRQVGCNGDKKRALHCGSGGIESHLDRSVAAPAPSTMLRYSVQFSKYTLSPRGQPIQ